MLKNKKGDLIGNLFTVILGLIIFFALYPAMAALLSVGATVQQDTEGVFLILAIPYVILIGVLVCVYRTVAGSGSSE